MVYERGLNGDEMKRIEIILRLKCNTTQQKYFKTLLENKLIDKGALG